MVPKWQAPIYCFQENSEKENIETFIVLLQVTGFLQEADIMYLIWYLNNVPNLVPKQFK